MADTMTSILLVDDDALVRVGLKMILGGHPEFQVVGEASDGHDAVRQYRALVPDVVLMDIRMPKLDGLAAMTEILAEFPSANVIILTTFDTDEFIVRALRAGSRGFLLKDSTPADLIRAVELAAQGHPTLSPTVTAQLMAKISNPPDPAATAAERAAANRLEQLTERELEVAQAIAQGLSNAEIARTLFMSVPTVKTHVSRILTKFEVERRVQIAILVHDASRS